MPQLTIQQALNLALQHHRKGDIREAKRLCELIVAEHPENADALHVLGVISQELGRSDLASNLIRRALALKPNWAIAWSNLGVSLQSMGLTEDSVAACRRAIALSPGLAEGYHNLGNAMQAKGDFDDAIVAYRQALALRPNYPDAQGNLASALQSQGQLDDAIAAFRQAIAMRPALADAHYNLGNALKENGQLDEAIAAYLQAIRLRGHYPEAYNNLGNALKETGRINQAIAAYRNPLAVNPDLAAIHSNIVYTLLFQAEPDLPALKAEYRRWNERHAQPLGRFIQPHTNDRDPDRKLRVGYVSGEFRDHVIGRMLLPYFRRHDHGRFQITCYSNVSRPSALTSQFQRHADAWRDIKGLSDDQVARQIRDDDIDILVDLSVHGAGNRLLVFARKPAPVQLTYLAYPDSTGMSAMDYRLSDPHLDPPEQDAYVYSEKTIRLPRTYWCYEPGGQTPEPAIGPATKNGFITLGCLNNFAKVSSAALDLWVRILTVVPNSRLLIHALPGSHRQAVGQRLQQAGIQSDRLHFSGKQPWAEYARTYSQIDIALDPFPYTGGVTTCDALWMGVPVVTLTGVNAVGRGGRSILANLGLSDLIADTPDQYVAIARGLAQDRGRLQQLRQTLRQRMLGSALMDADAFARDVESAFGQMWRAWCQSPPATTSVSNQERSR